MYQPSVRKPYQKSVRFEKDQKREHHNRTPDSVLHDKRLSASSRCVYAELAGAVHQGNTATIGQRRIASRLGFSKTTVNLSIRELAAHGHITVVAVGKQRHLYILNSNIFGEKQRDGVQEVQEYGPAKNPRRRLVSARVA